MPNPLKVNSFYISGVNVSVSGGNLIVGANTVVTSAQTGNFVTSSQTGSYVTTNQTGSFITTAQTGSFITVGQTGNFITTSQTGSFINTSMTGVYTDSAANLGTGSGIFGSKVGAQLQFKSLLPGSGVLFTGDANTLSINTYLGYQLKTSLSLDTTLPSGSTYYNILSGTVGPGTWLTVAQTTLRLGGLVNTSAKFVAQLWNGNTGAGIFSAAEATISTSGQTSSGFAPIDMTTIVNLTGASNTMALRVASTANNTVALSSPLDFATGTLSGLATYILMVRLL